MFLRDAYVLRTGSVANVVVSWAEGGVGGRSLIPFARVKSVSHVELARRACRIVGGTPLQRQVSRTKVKGVWIAPDEESPVMVTGADAIQEDESHGKD